MATKATRKLSPVQGDEHAEDLRRQIAEAAYYKAEQRGFEPGGEEKDWLDAESELKARLGPRSQP
jgi:Protein of unknown function (DUF2934)